MVSLLTNDFPLSDEECQSLQIDKREAHVAWLVLSGEKIEPAILRAGYRNKLTEIQLTLRPSYARAVDIMSRHFLQVMAAPAALAVQFKLLNAKDTAPGIRAQIAKTLMEMAGYGQEKGGNAGAVDLDKLDAATLDALIQDLEHRKAGKAMTIVGQLAIEGDSLDDRGDSGPNSEPDDSYLSEFM